MAFYQSAFSDYKFQNILIYFLVFIFSVFIKSILFILFM